MSDNPAIVWRFNPAYYSAYPEMKLNQKDGQWVRYTDYSDAIAERDAARAECERLNDMLRRVDQSQGGIDAYVDQCEELEVTRIDLARANEAIRNMGEAADKLRAEVERLKALLRQACEHIQELAEAWQRGCLTEHDGKGGMRSNRNWDLMCKLERELGLR